MSVGRGVLTVNERAPCARFRSARLARRGASRHVGAPAPAGRLVRVRAGGRSVLELVRQRVWRFGHAQALDLVGEDLLGPLQLGERELVVAVGVDDAEERMCRLGESLVVFFHAQRSVPVGVRCLEDGLDGRLGDFTDGRIELVGLNWPSWFVSATVKSACTPVWTA